MCQYMLYEAVRLRKETGNYLYTTHCYTKEDIKDSKKTIPNTSQKKNDCERKDVKVVGNKVTWTMQCKETAALAPVKWSTNRRRTTA